MRQHLVLTHQRRRSNLGHHKTRVQAGAGREEGRQTFVQRRIYQPFKPSLTDASERAERDAKKIQYKSHRLTVKVAAGKYVALRCAHHGAGRAVTNGARPWEDQ